MVEQDNQTGELEGLLAAAVARVLEEPAFTEDSVRRLCEATRLVLQALLYEEATWPRESFVDGIMPLSLEGTPERGLEMAAAAIVARDLQMLVEPLLVRFSVAGDQVLDFAILFADASREPGVFEATFDYDALHFPIAEDSWRFKFGVETAGPGGEGEPPS